VRRRERDTVGKYHVRLAREAARHHLREVFDFLKRGIPESWRQTTPRTTRAEVREAQAAVREFLTSTCSDTPPSAEALDVVERCLNLPVTVEACTRKVHFDGEWTPRVLFAFETPHYLKQVVERLRISLSEFYEVAVRTRDLEGWPVGLCAKCGNVFLKGKTNQVCCSRSCTNAYDYARRKGELGAKYFREKSKRSYDSPGARRNRAMSRGTRRKRDDPQA
jgi:hypothetical protein